MLSRSPFAWQSARLRALQLDQGTGFQSHLQRGDRQVLVCPSFTGNAWSFREMLRSVRDTSFRHAGIALLTSCLEVKMSRVRRKASLTISRCFYADLLTAEGVPELASATCCSMDRIW